jgi:hypothetical protein
VELIQVKAERDRLLAALRELKAAVQARWEAEARVAALHRKRSIARGRTAQCDPGMPLQ